MKIDENAEREAFEAFAMHRALRFPLRPDGEYASTVTQEAWEAWRVRAAQPVRVRREALCRALNDNHSPDVSFADITEAALKALGIEVIDA